MPASTRLALRERLRAPQPLVVPGCYDVLSARLIEQAGFEAVLVSGFGVSASLLGLPDVELATASEMAGVCRSVCRRVARPVLADADNGYGNALNVMRTVAELEAAGVASITLEDQRSPKRCPLISADAELLDVPEAVGKLRAALAARSDPALMVVARTDAREPQEVLHRARAYAEAGVDGFKLISPALRSTDLLDALRAEFPALPLFISSLGWAATQDAALFHGRASVITHPLLPLAGAARSVRDNLEALRQGLALPAGRATTGELEQMLGMDEVHRHESAFLPV
ncbi:isocitrate lyase/PEP mutase family protein [Aquincola sp. MAHUQ-54]|uniref:Isocitrate lyase/PEP mutase family protein n=1 Tax=Aquincola agrisoli TaxID=3119538 RepID=A0AAW9QDM0_9BURK